MTREEAIQHWLPIVRAVIRAENNLDEEWLPRLREAKDATSDEQVALIAEYYAAIAAEIMSKTTDEELSKMSINDEEE